MKPSRVISLFAALHHELTESCLSAVLFILATFAVYREEVTSNTKITGQNIPG